LDRKNNLLTSSSTYATTDVAYLLYISARFSLERCNTDEIWVTEFAQVLNKATV